MGRKRYFNDTKNYYRKRRGFSNKYNYKATMYKLLYNKQTIYNVNFQSASVTYCHFKKARLEAIEFSHTNLKKCKFDDAHLKNVIFFAANLNNVSFRNTTFENVYFINTDFTKAMKLNIKSSGVKIINRHPEIKINKYMESVLFELSTYPQFVNFKVLHVTKDKLNLWRISILMDMYTINQLIRSFKALQRRKDKRYFFTLGKYISFLNNYLKL